MSPIVQILLISLVVIPVLADSDGTPKLRFETMEDDFGDLLQGELIEKVLRIYNDGDEVLQVWRATPNCSCTKIVSLPNQVPPGGSAEIRFTVDSKKIKAGETRKGITVETDDPKNPRLRYIFNVGVISLFHTEPAIIRLGGLMNLPKETRVRLIADTVLGFEILGVRSRNGLFTVDSIEEIEKDRIYEAQISVQSSDKPVKTRDPLDLMIRVKDGREVIVGRWVEIEHLDPIQINPARVLQFGNKDTDHLLVKESRGVSKVVTIVSIDESQKLTVKSVTLEGFPEGVFEVETTEQVPGRRFAIRVTLNVYREELVLRGQLVIETDAPNEPRRVIQVMAKFGRL